MAKYCVLGAGRQGAAIVYDLARFADASEIHLMDKSTDASQSIKDRISSLIPGSNIIIHEADVLNHHSLVSLMDEMDVMSLEAVEESPDPNVRFCLEG